jgi:hypothetical protein
VDPHGAGGLRAVAADLPNRRAELRQDRAHAPEQVLAGLRQRHAARGPVEKSYPDARLEGPDRLAQGRRRDAERLRGPAEAQGLRHGHEGAQVGEVAAGDDRIHAGQRSIMKPGLQVL